MPGVPAIMTHDIWNVFPWSFLSHPPNPRQIMRKVSLGDGAVGDHIGTVQAILHQQTTYKHCVKLHEEKLDIGGD